MVVGKFFKNINQKNKNHHFSGLSFNSKKVKKNNIFFAIRGTKINANRYIKEAIKKGATTVVSNLDFQGLKNSILYIKSNNSRKLLSEVASKFYKDKPKNLIAVTGTNGKSSIADFYFQILNLNNKKVASIGTLGINTYLKKTEVKNTTLDPISLNYHLKKIKKLNINNIILEASSHGLKQNRLDGLKFDVGIFSNLSHDHLDYHKSYKDYLNSKLYLFEKLLKKKSTIITDFNIPEYKRIKNISLKKKTKLITILNKNSDLSVISHQYLEEKQLLNIKYKKNFYSFRLNLIGKTQVKNVLMAIIAATKSNIKIKKIINVLNKIKPVHGRMEKVGAINNNSCVILDYAHTPEALLTCLQNVRDQFKNRKISIVFGCGGDRDKFKRPIMGKITNKYCDKIYLTDDNPRFENPKNIRLAIKKKINQSKLFEISKREKAIEKAIKNLNTGEILVVAGRGHETIQDYGNTKRFFSDKNFILKYIKRKNKKIKKDLKFNILKEVSKQNYFSTKSKIRKASINSKEIKKNDVFFAIRGKKKDGNLFLKEAFDKGASLAVVNRINKSVKRNKQIKVENSLDFLTKTSKIVRANSNGKIIAITGSCGKTSLKELLVKTLVKFGKVTFSPKSFNNKYGVPLSLFNLNPNHEYGIFEVGMDKKGEIDQLSKIIKPDIGVITNISYAHAKNFKNLKQIALAKSEIINNINKDGIIVLNADDKFFDLHKKIALKRNLKIYSFSMTKNSNIRLNYVKKEKYKFKISILIGNKNKYFFVPFNFENYIKNLLAAITIISIFKDITKLDKNIFYNFKAPIGRGDISRIKFRNKNIFLVDESYNSNPLSLKSAIKNFNSIKTLNKKHMVLGDMLELGKHSKSLHQKMGATINSTSIDKVNVFGKHIKETYKKVHIKKKGLILKENSQIFDLINNNINNNDYLMIKGSNSTGLHSLVDSLKKGNMYAL
jgi:murE/murF fusion protein